MIRQVPVLLLAVVARFSPQTSPDDPKLLKVIQDEIAKS